MTSFELIGADGKRIKGDRIDGTGRQILFITGFLSKRWGNKSKSLAQWCQEKGWGFCCYDVRGFGDSEGQFTDYTLSDWIADAHVVLDSIKTGPPVTVVGNSLGSWIGWLVAQEFIEPGASGTDENRPILQQMIVWAARVSKAASFFSIRGTMARARAPRPARTAAGAGAASGTAPPSGVAAGRRPARPSGLLRSRRPNRGGQPSPG